MNDLEKILRNYNTDLQDYLENNQVDESILFEAVKSYNVKAYNLLIDKVELVRKEELFELAIIHTPEIALDLFKKYKDEFHSHGKSLIYENLNTDDDKVRNLRNEEVFVDNYPLPRHYKDVEYSNTTQLFAAMLLNNSLRIEGHGETNLENLEYLLQNRKELDIKDETIVQYFVEGVYKLSYEDEDSSFVQYNADQFKKIADKLFEHNVSFDSDTQGYLIQILAVNLYDLKRYRIEFEHNFIQKFIDNGSNIENYKLRLDNQDNWLNQQDDYKLEFYHERFQEYDYDIYKKFDSNNNALALKYLQAIINYQFKHEAKQVEEAAIVPVENKVEIHHNQNSEIQFNTKDDTQELSRSSESLPTISKGSSLQKIIGSLRETFSKNSSHHNDIKNK